MSSSASFRSPRRAFLSAIGLTAALLMPAATQAALVNVSGEVTNPNATIGAGNTANFVGNGSFGWQTGTTSIPVINNGFTFTLDSGNGNALNYAGDISGSGDVHFHMAPFWSGLANNAMIISGSTSNTYSGTSYIDYGHVQLQKTGGAIAIPGNVIIGGQGANDRLSLGASNQIADTAVVSFTGSTTATLNLNGFSDTIGVLQVKPNAVVDTGAGGSLTVGAINFDGAWLSAGNYAAGSLPFITGSGSLNVTGATVETGDSIGLNFAGANNNPGGRKALGASVIAGAPGYEQANWNNTLGTAQTGPGSSANDSLTNLVDNKGFATTLDLTFSSPQTWGHDFGPNPTGDQMLNGNGITDGVPTVTVTDVPFSEYDVIVYIGMYAPGRNSTYTLDDGTLAEQIFAFAPNWADFTLTGWDQVSENATSAAMRDTGNYIVFSGLTSSSFTLTSNGGGGINAIQIVNAAAAAVPEPATMTMLGLAALGLARRGRRTV